MGHNTCTCARIIWLCIYPEPTMMPVGKHMYLTTILFTKVKTKQNPNADKKPQTNKGVMVNSSFQILIQINKKHVSGLKHCSSPRTLI